MPRVLLRDVALAAGVSLATASRAMRGDPRITAATTQQVTRAADQLGYRPDPALAALAAYRRPGEHGAPETIAVLSTWPSHRAVQHEPPDVLAHAARLGYRLESVRLGTAPEEHRAVAEQLLARGVRGLLLSTGRVQQDDLDLPWDRFACVSVSGAPAMRRVHAVTTNYAENLRLALEQLAAHGYRRPGLVVNQWLVQATRGACFAGWGYVHGLFPGTLPPPLVVGARDGSVALTWARRAKLDALISGDSGLARRLHAAGARIPRDFGFCSLDLMDGDRTCAGIHQERSLGTCVALDLLATRLRHHDLGPVAQPYALQLPGTWQAGPSLRDKR
jgi:hypothetical protein